MPYTASSQGVDANCAKTFMEGPLHTALTAVLTYVEQYVNGAVTCRVYKSVAANNFFGQDWYLNVKRFTDTTTVINLSVSELYNSTTHLFTNYAPGSTSLTPTAQFAVNDVTGKAPDSGSLFSSALGISTSGFQYWFSCTADRVVLATRSGGIDYGWYAGLYDDLQAPAISPFPLVVCKLTGSNNQQTGNGAATREPNTLASNNYNFFAYPNSFSGSVMSWLTPTAITGGLELYSNKVWMSRAVLSGARSGLYVRGLLRGVWYAGAAAAVNGDTLTATLSGVSKTLTCIRDGSNAYYFWIDPAL